MDINNVLDLPSSLEELELDFNKWMQLSYDQRSLSNTFCIYKYGCTNEQLYNIMKAQLILHDKNNELEDPKFQLEQVLYRNKRLLHEGSINIDIDTSKSLIGMTKDGSVNNKLEKIAKANSYMDEDDDVVIINDFMNDNIPDYSLQDLEAKWNLYNSSNNEHRDRSNALSISIWGYNVIDMYNIMKNKLITKEEHIKDIKTPDMSYDINNAEIKNFIATADSESDNELQFLIRKADGLCKENRTVDEYTIFENYFDTINIKGKKYGLGVPEVTPFLTYDEYVNNPRCLDSSKLDLVDPFTYVFNFKDNQKASLDEIRSLYRDHNDKGLLELGWNPYVEPTNENIKYARDRQIKYLEEYCDYSLVDITKFDTDDTSPLEEAYSYYDRENELVPIFILVSKGVIYLNNNASSNDEYRFGSNTYYGNAGICLEPYLNNIYYLSSNNLYVGDRNEYNSLTLGGEVSVLVIFVTPEIRRKISSGLIAYANNSRSNFYYNYITLSSKQSKSREGIVSNFLQQVFAISNMDINKGYIAPQIIYSSPSKSKANIFIVFEGKLWQYDANKVNNKINTLLKRKNYTDLYMFKPGSSVKRLYTYKLENCHMRTDDEEVNEVLKEIHELLTPTNYIKSCRRVMTIDEAENIVNESHLFLSEANMADCENIRRHVNKLEFIKECIEYKVSNFYEYIDDIDRIKNMYAIVCRDVDTYSRI